VYSRKNDVYSNRGLPGDLQIPPMKNMIDKYFVFSYLKTKLIQWNKVLCFLEVLKAALSGY